MAYVPVDNVCQAELIYQWAGQGVENVLHFKPSVGLEPALMNELGAHLVSWWDVTLQPLMPNNLTINAVKLTDLTLQIAPSFEYTTGLPLTGSTGQPSLPNNVALAIKKNTILRGRSYRGRIFHPGLQENQVVDNAVSATPLAAIVDAYELLISFSTAGADWDMQVVSRIQEGAPLVTGIATDVLSLSSDGMVDSQRRRLPGRGA